MSGIAAVIANDSARCLSKKFDEEFALVPMNERKKWLNLFVNTPKKEQKRLDAEALR